MEFATFADRAGTIDAEPADLEIVAHVRDLLAAADDEIEVVARFVQGRVFPAWDSTTLDIGPSACYEAIARAAGQNVSGDDVEERLADVGEIGDVAASYEFGGQQGLGAFTDDAGGTDDDLTVREVADTLTELAAAEGSGSHDRKVDLLFGLFNRASSEEARYLARLVLSEMRIGVGEGTVRDAIAAAFEVPEDRVERALQVSNDYGRVARIARDEGVAGLDAMDLAVGRPVQAMLAQAGTVTDALEEWDEAAVEWKYDGARCISGYTPIYTRERGQIAVRDVEVGDSVLTHEGRFREIVAKNRRSIDSKEKVFEFSTYFGTEFKITEGHEMLVYDSGDTEWVPIEDVSENETLAFPVPTIRPTSTPPDRLQLSTIDNYTKEFELSPSFYRFLGYWVGDGSTNDYNGNNRIGLMFSNTDADLLEEYRSIVVDALGISPENVHTYDHGSATDIYWTDGPLFKWLCENFRKNYQDGWRDKTVPDWFWNLSEDQFDAFLTGWEEADGYEDPQGRRYITTKERYLASVIQLIGLTFGRIFGIRRVRKNDKTYYRLTISQSDRYARIEDDFVVVDILSKTELSRKNPREVDPRQKVYNLQVAEDESYCVPLTAVHNCQLHFDGESVSVFSRNMEEVTDALPEVVEFADETLEAPAILDGEVVAVDDDGSPLPFQEVLKRFRRKHDVAKAREDVSVRPVFFDCLHAGGEDLLAEPLTTRHDRLRSVLAAADSDGDDGTDGTADADIEGLSLLRLTDDPDEIESIDADALEAGHEGIMLKDPESTYSPGRRGKHWRKRKPDVETIDCVVTGAEWGEGRRATFLGTFELAVRAGDEFETVGKVATGITDEKLEELTELLEPHIAAEDGQAVDLEPAVVFEVGYEEIQSSPTYSSGYALRFPRFQGVRSDKDPEGADSLERLERLRDQ
ncbi:ATP-dependent DNA ligase [Natrinema thermotolerans]|uniref:DNA ligase n=1 Tax=Natrinema thermotolerans TaxID=121872 RepID=A0AAF0PBU6_9EURY|nr:ATP-dependent DNA ligase [Natrinema thermotolerans]WMT07690.1 ATP-dependent DNA ligase [Natrinema thermotolerans]WMT08322.1 ATP-dependent DNA ligase [Natrinema thermotolerans]